MPASEPSLERVVRIDAEARGAAVPIRTWPVRSLQKLFATSWRDVLLVGVAATILSVGAFIYFYDRGMTNVYGDGVAHVNIARKVVDHPDDSFWQRYMQIGSPWLPLQTFLMLPLVADDWMWRTGVAGSIVSMFCFVIAAISLYLHAKHLYRKEAEGYKVALPLISAAIFLFNASGLYLQTTPMSEPVFMGTLAAAAYLLQRWVAGQTIMRLAVAAIAMTLAALARYEAWPVSGLAVAIVTVASHGKLAAKLKNAAIFSTLVAIGPLYWLWHNHAIYGNPFEFLTGPYSARGVYLQQQASLGWAKVFVGNFTLDVLLMLLSVSVCVGLLVMAVAAAGFIRLIAIRWHAIIEDAPVVLLIAPFFFHVLSLYRGEIQIFPLSAFGLLNVRYGLPHLLPIALIAPAAAAIFSRLGKAWAIAILCSIVAAQYWLMLSEGPSQLAIYQEGYRNGVNAQVARERARLASFIRENPPRPVILMNTGELGPVVSQGGLRFSDLIHEGTARWHQIIDDIPDDVSTILIQENDPLHRRFLNNQALARNLQQHFHERFSAGRMKLFERVNRLDVGKGGVPDQSDKKSLNQ